VHAPHRGPDIGERLADGAFQIAGELVEGRLAQRLDLVAPDFQRLLGGGVEEDAVPDQGAVGEPALGRFAAQPDDAAARRMIAAFEAPERLAGMLLASQLLEAGAILGKELAEPDLGVPFDVLFRDA